MNRYIIITLLVAFAFCGCRHNHGNEQLANVESILNDDPQTALDSLYSINYDSLTDAEKHYYDFLTVKVNDKNYIEHETDSLIKEVVAYESHHKGNGRYPESLYYAGRVYSDMGDYPRAIIYFQKALETIKYKNDVSDLKARITSQYGRLLTNMGLYDEAIPLIQTSLDIGRKTNDYLNIINDLQLLAGVNMKAGNLYQAEQLYRETYYMANGKYPHFASKSLMYIASIKHTLHQNDSALLYAYNIVDKVDPMIRSHALSIAANIYLEAGVKDTAYMYALELVHNGDSISKETGYNILLDPELSCNYSSDSLLSYINNYHGLLKARFDGNRITQTIKQQNIYNYQVHAQEKETIQRNNRNLRAVICSLLLILLLFGYIILLVRNNNKTKIIRLQQALANIKTLKSNVEQNELTQLSEQNTTNYDKVSPNQKFECQSADNQPTIVPSEKILRKKLQEELMQIYEKSGDNVIIQHQILRSETFMKFIETARQGKMIPDSDSLWKELEDVVLKSSPRFKDNLLLLSSGRLTVPEFHTAILIKCGFRPVDMQVLLGKTNGAIISRRYSICMKVFDTKLETKIITNIIRLI